MRNPSTSTNGGTASNSKTTPCCSKVGMKRGPWTPEEDELLANYIKKDGEGRWRTLPKRAGLLRCGKSCRLRWMNYLRPCVKRGQIAPDEEDLILRLHRLLGNRWSLIAGRIPGRTDNEIKNYWNTHLSKKLISQGIDPRTHKPLLSNPSSDNPKPSSSKPKNRHVVPIISPNPNPSSSSSGLEEIIKGNKGNNNNGYFENTNLLDQEYQTGTNGISSNEDEGDTNYCTDDVFSSFLNSLINEDVFASQHQQMQHVNHQLVNGIIAPAAAAGSSDALLISSAQAFGFSGTGWETALVSNPMPSAFNQMNDPRGFEDDHVGEERKFRKLWTDKVYQSFEKKTTLHYSSLFAKIHRYIMKQ